MKRLLACVWVLAACGGDDDATRDAAVDALRRDASTIDAPPDAQAFVLTVTCPSSVAQDVGVSTGVYSPSTYTINVNDIVRFTTSGVHNVTPHGSLPTDPGLNVNFSQVVCKQFTVTGTFNYRCSVHGFVGTATVN